MTGLSLSVSFLPIAKVMGPRASSSEDVASFAADDAAELPEVTASPASSESDEQAVSAPVARKAVAATAVTALRLNLIVIR